MSSNTVFLSHRRDDVGKPLAHTLREALTGKGYDVFLDVNDMESGPWPDQLLHEASSRSHFLLLITPGALKKCSNREDWMRKEFEQAERTRRNIVPIFGDGVEVGVERELCPADMRHLFKLQGTRVAYDTLQRDLKELIEKYISPEKAPPDQRHNLPFASIGQGLKGREADLDRVRDALRDSQAQAVGITTAQAIHGLGGVGKTRLAVEYAWRRLDDYARCLFVPADTPQNLAAGLAGLCKLLGLPEAGVADQSQQVAAVCDWLSRPHLQPPSSADPPIPWLLILDNVDDEAAALAVQQLVETIHRGRSDEPIGHVLITARFTTFGPSVKPLPLDVLEADAAVELLMDATEGRRRETDDDSSAARELAKRLEYLAVALEQAAAYIFRRRVSFADYQAEWDRNLAAVADWHDELRMQYPRSVAATWVTTVERLSEAARSLLDALSWLASDPLPASVFADQRPALVELAEFSMVKWDASSNDHVQVHRLVQEITRLRIPADRRRESLAAALQAVDAAIPAEPGADNVRSWPVWDVLRLHVGRLIEHAEQHAIAEPTSRLMNDLGLLLSEKALHTEAEPLMRRALEIDEQSVGTEHPNVAIRLNNLAQLLQDTNRLSEAEPLMRRALALDEQSFGTKHPNVARDLNNLAALLQVTNRLPEAELLMRRALALDEQFFRNEHPNIARDLNNLAQLLQATSRLSEAEPLMRRALAIVEQSFGPEHPEVAIRLGNVAQLLEATNCMIEAEPLMRRALAIDEQSFGTEHPNVAIRLNNLAQLLQATNRLIEAEPLMRCALAIDERSFGTEHSEVAIQLNNLALLLRTTKRLSEAEPLSRRQLEILVLYNKANSHEHPHFRAAQQNYTVILHEQELSQSEIEQRLKAITEVEGPLGPMAAEVERLLGPAGSVDEALARLDEQYRSEGRPEIYFLKLDEPIAPHLDQLLGPARPTDEVLKSLDEQYRKEGRPDVWFLPLDQPIAPHLDELLGPVDQ